MRLSIVPLVHLLVLPPMLVAEAAWAQNPTPAARTGRAEALGDSSNIYVSSTLPPTGHPTLFKKYATAGRTGTTPQRSRPAISPYLNLARPGNPALNYFLGVQRDQQVFDTGMHVQELNTQVGGLQRGLQKLPRRTPPLREAGEEELTPLKRRALEQRGELVDETRLVETLRKMGSAQNESSQQEQTALKAILDELKSLRESLSPKKEATEQEKTKDGAESK